MEAASMIKLIIESRLENVGLIGGAVRGIAQTLSLDKITSYHLELCVVEAVNNATKHAYHSEAGNWVEVDIVRQKDRLTFKVCDRGDSMKSMEAVPLKFDPSNVETLPEGGMGIFILNSLMDEIAYESVNGRNILTMIKYLRKRKRSMSE
jgi:serine/threonine-protein kinase RsbW